MQGGGHVCQLINDAGVPRDATGAMKKRTRVGPLSAPQRAPTWAVLHGGFVLAAYRQGLHGGTKVGGGRGGAWGVMGALITSAGTKNHRGAKMQGGAHGEGKGVMVGLIIAQ